MITTRKQGPKQYRVVTTGAAEVILVGGSTAEWGPVVPPNGTTQFIISGSVLSTVVGGEAPGSTGYGFGPIALTAARSGGTVTITSDDPDLSANVITKTLAGSLVVRIRANDDDAELTGIDISVEDDRSAGGGTRTTTATATVERPSETLGSA
jgi:hypothetical protein